MEGVPNLLDGADTRCCLSWTIVFVSCTAGLWKAAAAAAANGPVKLDSPLAPAAAAGGDKQVRS